MTISQVITALPDAPNPATMTATEFSNAAAASVLAQKAMTPELNTFGTQANALAVSVNADATAAAGSAAAAATSATNASNSATAAAVTANAAAWAAGTYALNANAISGLDGQTYRNFVSAGVRNTDPKNDPTYWVKLGAPAELWTKGANIASAATINLTTATGDYVHVTGTTTITAITIPVGAERTVIFDGALTLTHGAALLLPGAANITTAANDRMTVRGDTAGAIVVDYTKASGLPVVSVTPGSVLLATLTPTAAANVDFLTTFTASYDCYLIEGIGLQGLLSQGLSFQFANAGVVDAGANYFSTTGSGTTVAQTSGYVTTSNITGVGGNFSLRVSNVNDAVKVKSAMAAAMVQGASTPEFSYNLTGTAYKATSAVSGIRFFWGSGTTFAAQGKIRIYGISNT